MFQVDNISDSVANKLGEESKHVNSSNTLEILAKKLTDSDNTICHLKSEVSNLKLLVEHLSSENKELKTRLSHNNNEVARSNGDERLTVIHLNF